MEVSGQLQVSRREEVGLDAMERNLLAVPE
jgi:hypothetical protein